MKKRNGLIVFLALFLSVCHAAKEPSTAAGGEAVAEDSGAMARYEIGDMILADGSAIHAAEFVGIDDQNAPIAVIAGFRDDDTALGIGVHRSDAPLPWASDHSAGYATRFEAIVSTQEAEARFAGDRDGSDNWSAVVAQDDAGSKAPGSYPAFDFVNAYAEAHHLSGSWASGWYMPSIAELYVIYQNREAVNLSLKSIYQSDNRAAMNGLDVNWYWSSSQADSEDDCAWFVHFLNGYAGECPKNFTNVHGIAVRAF